MSGFWDWSCFGPGSKRRPQLPGIVIRIRGARLRDARVQCADPGDGLPTESALGLVDPPRSHIGRSKWNNPTHDGVRLLQNRAQIGAPESAVLLRKLSSKSLLGQKSSRTEAGATIPRTRPATRALYDEGP